jgi:polyisoprenoid-binding protein YceI
MIRTSLAFAAAALFATGLMAEPTLAHNHKGKAVVVEAPSGAYAADPAHSSIVWRVNYLGLANYTARFVKFDADLTFDAAAPEKSSVTVNIDPTSVRTEYPFKEKKDFDAALSTEDRWFNSAKFPQITFLSTGVKRTGPKTGKMTGNLTLLGVTKPVTLDVTFNNSMKEHPFAKKSAIGFSAKGSIKRSDFGMSALVPNIADNVEIIIEAVFMGK